jgi:hypothetical protein
MAGFAVQVLTAAWWIEQAKKKIQRSMVADNESGKSVKSEVRTSSGMFLDKRQVRPSVSTLHTASMLHH